MRSRAALACILPLLALAILGVGCGDDDSSTSGSDGGAVAEETAEAAPGSDGRYGDAGGNLAAPSGEAVRAEKVEIVEFTYEPDPVTIQAGGKVTWLNQDQAPHTATAEDGGFDTGTLGQGKLKAETFKQPGSFAYHCEIHPEMRGMIEVVDSS